MNLLEMLEFLETQIKTVSTVSDVALSPPQLTLDNVYRRNYPAVNIWDDGFTPVTEGTMVQSFLRRYNIKIAVFVKNPQDELMSTAYVELLKVEEAISKVINDLSAKGGSGEFVLRGQNTAGVRALAHQDIDYYLLARETTFIADVWEGL